MSETPALALRAVSFRHPGGDFTLRVDALTLARGERVACIGPSGSGKTTLAHLLAGLLVPQEGTVVLDGRPLSSLPDAERRQRRLTEIGLLFQDLELLEPLDVEENIALPFHLGAAGSYDAARRAFVRDLARAAGLDAKLHSAPRRLSQGERQRVALCRALATQPRLVVADEPTGHLDPGLARQMVDELLARCADTASTLFVVTHDHSLLSRFDRVLDMERTADWSAT